MHGSMDPASLVAFIGFGIQVVGIISQLIDFLEKVKDAPDNVRKLREELILLRRLVKTFRASEETREVPVPEDLRELVEDASKRVEEQVGDLLTLLKKTLPEGKSGRPRQLWNKVKAVLQEDKVNRLTAELERAKGTLGMAQQTLQR